MNFCYDSFPYSFCSLEMWLSSEHLADCFFFCDLINSLVKDVDRN